MTTPPPPAGELSPTQRALLALREAKAEIARLRDAGRQPIAVVGLGCRLPGADDPEAYWRLLRDGVEAVGAVPAERWDADALYDPDPAAPGRTYARRGAFVAQGGELDAAFFGIAPREVESLDPQQRLLLEVVWEALEDAGQPPRDDGRRTGVFVGIASSDYAGLLQARGSAAIDAYLATGTAHSVAAGRLSFLLGLRGPSLAVDTACSSSLVAVHLACQSLRAGECDLAIAAGVNRILSPELSIAFAKNQMLSPTGRCHTFDAAADGFVRGEGCGAVVLRRLDDALAAGDRVLAVVAGSAVGQDGRTSGLTVPNGPAQQAVIADALAAAGVPAAEVVYVEAHGTGTPLGDPLEIAALAAAYGRDRREPLLVGSAKTNLGHLEAAAGIAGLIKTVLAIDRGELPPHLHLERPNPRTDWRALPVEVVTRRRPWPAGRRMAGVSSFGFSGTNCHVILAAQPASPEAATETDGTPPHLLVLSARSPTALAALADGVRQRWLDLPGGARDGDLAALCRDAARRRAHLEHRLAVVAADGDELAARLAKATAETDDGARLAAGVWRRRIAPPPATVFLFSGQGSALRDAGRELWATEPVFRRTIERCDAATRDLLPRSLAAALYEPANGEDDEPASDPRLAAPALFALQVALAELWQSKGVEPDALLGHSLGEYAAACVAAVMTAEDGARLVAERAALVAERVRPGAMAAVAASAEEVAEALAAHRHEVAVAAWNGPRQAVLAGSEAGVAAVLGALAGRGTSSVRLAATHPFHSPAMDPVLPALGELVARYPLAAPRLPMISTLTAGEVGDELTAPEHWVRHAREPVRFAAALAALAASLGDGASGPRAWIEIGPQPVLLALARRLVEPAASSAGTDDDDAFLPSLRSGRGDRETLVAGLAELQVRGAVLRWQAIVGDGPRGRLILPTYPWQRQPFPLVPPAATPAITVGGPTHPLLGQRLPAVADRGGEHVWQHVWRGQDDPASASGDRLAFLDGHRLGGRALVSLGVFLELARAAAAEIDGDAPPPLVTDLEVHAPLFLDDGVVVQSALAGGSSTADGGDASFRVHSRAGDATAWRLHASMRLHRRGAADTGRQARHSAPRQAEAG